MRFKTSLIGNQVPNYSAIKIDSETASEALRTLEQLYIPRRPYFGSNLSQSKSIRQERNFTDQLLSMKHLN
jgi:hypothetical protein